MFGNSIIEITLKELQDAGYLKHIRRINNIAKKNAFVNTIILGKLNLDYDFYPIKNWMSDFPIFLSTLFNYKEENSEQKLDIIKGATNGINTLYDYTSIQLYVKRKELEKAFSQLFAKTSKYKKDYKKQAAFDFETDKPKKIIDIYSEKNLNDPTSDRYVNFIYKYLTSSVTYSNSRKKYGAMLKVLINMVKESPSTIVNVMLVKIRDMFAVKNSIEILKTDDELSSLFFKNVIDIVYGLFEKNYKFNTTDEIVNILTTIYKKSFDKKEKLPSILKVLNDINIKSIVTYIVSNYNRRIMNRYLRNYYEKLNDIKNKLLKNIDLRNIEYVYNYEKYEEFSFYYYIKYYNEKKLTEKEIKDLVEDMYNMTLNIIKEKYDNYCQEIYDIFIKTLDRKEQETFIENILLLKRLFLHNFTEIFYLKDNLKPSNIFCILKYQIILNIKKQLNNRIKKEDKINNLIYNVALIIKEQNIRTLAQLNSVCTNIHERFDLFDKKYKKNILKLKK
jgi:hypothetical protein